MKKVKHPRTCPDYVISTFTITHMLQRCVYRCWKTWIRSIHLLHLVCMYHLTNWLVSTAPIGLNKLSYIVHMHC